MKKFILIIIILFAVHTSFCQNKLKAIDTDFAENSLYFSLGGAGIYNSLNYERTLFYSDKYSAGAKIGLGSSFSLALFPEEFAIPVGGYFLYGKKNSHFDISFGVTNYFMDQYDYNNDKNYKEIKLLFVPSIAYRFQKSNGGFMGRVGFSPILYFNKIRNSISPWMDISLGWSF